MTTPDLSDLNTYEREKLRALLAAIDPDDIPALRSMLDGHIACEAEVMSIKPRPVPTLDSAEPLACDVPCRNRLRVYQEGEPGRPGCSWVPDGSDYSCTVCGLHVPEGTRMHGLVVIARDSVGPGVIEDPAAYASALESGTIREVEDVDAAKVQAVAKWALEQARSQFHAADPACTDARELAELIEIIRHSEGILLALAGAGMPAAKIG